MARRTRLQKIARNLVLSSGSYVLAKLASFVPESWQEIRLTENCNSKCITCSAWRRRSANELSLAELSDAFRQLRELGASRVTFTGGEPLLRPDITDIIKKAKSTGFENVMLITNGLLLEERSAELVNSGLSHLLVSIDGMQDVDSVVKGVPTHFEKAVAGIRAINKLKEEENQNFKTVILTTLLEPNAREVPQLIEMCHELKASWLFNLLECNSDLFRDIDVQKLGFSNHGTIDLLFDRLKYMKQKYPSVAYFCSHELDYARGFLRGEIEELPCINGYQGISIGAHGEVYSSCFALPPVGNLRDKPLSQIIDTPLYRNRLTEMYRRQCPGCTNLWAENVIARHIVAHTLICQRSRKRKILDASSVSRVPECTQAVTAEFRLPLNNISLRAVINCLLNLEVKQEILKCI